MTFCCSKCGESKSLSEFHKRNIPRGHDAWCKSCKSAYRKAYYSRDPMAEKIRSREKAWKAQGIDMNYATYLRLITEQNNKCALCETATDSFDVDHCHTTGKVRGLLCGSCNRGLGQFKDDVTILQKAITYLNDKNSSNS